MDAMYFLCKNGKFLGYPEPAEGIKHKIIEIKWDIQMWLRGGEFEVRLIARNGIPFTYKSRAEAEEACRKDPQIKVACIMGEETGISLLWAIKLGLAH